jgi:hypothetical protein
MRQLSIAVVVVSLVGSAGAMYMLEYDPLDYNAAIITGDGQFAAYFVSTYIDVDFEMVYTGSLAAVTDVTEELAPILGPGTHWFIEFADGGQPGVQILPTGIVARMKARDTTYGCGYVAVLRDAETLEEVGAVFTPEPGSIALIMVGSVLIRRRRRCI